VINGSKTYITNGVYGNFVTVACKTDPGAGIGGISLIVVESGCAGIYDTEASEDGFSLVRYR
jgi:alkylation response protein AidB-like acyl-CoA dehydrogenase